MAARVRPGLKASDQAAVLTSLLEIRTELPGRHARAREAVLEAAPLALCLLLKLHNRAAPNNLSLLATRIQANDVDADLDAGNVALFKLLRLDAAEVSAQGKASVKSVTSQEDAEQVQNQLAKRQHTLAEAGEGPHFGRPKGMRGEKHKLEFRADGDWVRVVVVENDVDIELDQRSAGFLVWLVSFYVVFKAETADNLANAILPSRRTRTESLMPRSNDNFAKLCRQSRRAIKRYIRPIHLSWWVQMNCTWFAWSNYAPGRALGSIKGSPALIRPRYFPSKRHSGTAWRNRCLRSSPNLVCEGLTDFWYIEGMSNLLGERKRPSLREDIAIVPAGGASKVAYFAVLLRAQKLQVAALLDSDTEGEHAAGLSEFVYALGRAQILRTGDFTAKVGTLYHGRPPYDSCARCQGRTWMGCTQSRALATRAPSPQDFPDIALERTSPSISW